MKLELTDQEFRYLLDLVYIGNWVINSTRENDRIQEYDQVESLIFSHCLHHKMSKLVELYRGELIPSRAFADGGIHEAIEQYEDVVFYEILAEGKSRMQAQMTSGGHSVAAGRTMSYGSIPGAVSEEISGIPFYRLITDLEAHFDVHQ